ncbi:MAG: response regulator [Nitrospinae bacterium]|nr:response regulator [Nitrospinota bacterium]
MIRSFFGKSKNAGKPVNTFAILLFILLFLAIGNIWTRNSSTQHQLFTEQFYKHMQLLKSLESSIEHQIHLAQNIVIKNEGIEKFENKTNKIFSAFGDIENHVKSHPEFEEGQSEKELKNLQNLKNDYTLHSKKLKSFLIDARNLKLLEAEKQLSKIIEESYSNNIQKNLIRSVEEEKRELSEINLAAEENNKREVFILWSFLGISLCFYFVVYRDLSTSTVSKRELEKINQELQAEVNQKVDAESRAKHERQNLYNILDSLPIAFHLQAPDYSVPFANKVFRERFGENIEKPCYKLMHNRSEPCEVCTTFKVFDHGKNESSIWDAPDGKTYLTVCTPFTDMDGSPLVMEMALDITEQENSKRQAEIAMAEAEKANLAKSDFLARMSHELRTPLNSILGFSQLLLFDKQNTLKPIQKENVERIVKGGQHLLELINEVLDLSKIESGSPNLKIENISLRSLIGEVHELIEPMVEKEDISLKSSLEAGPDILVSGDRVRLKQVLLNLASNAIKYNQPKGKIFIYCNQPEDGKVKITISDTGRGISEKDLDIIFDPFQRIHASAENIEGTGIGLSISKQLIKAMKGNISVKSELGKGSSFIITLQTGEGKVNSYNPAQIIEPTILKSGIKTGRNYKILYIEDNLANMELVGCAFFGSDIKFLQAPDARLGIDIARAHKPDLILMDINLPGMDGYEALKIIRRDPHIGSIPVFALSADCLESDIRNGISSGFDEYISKPIKISDFVEKVNTILS